MTDSNSADSIPMFTVGLFVGVVVGFFIFLFIASRNDEHRYLERQKQLVSLNVASYDSKTGQFHIHGCEK